MNKVTFNRIKMLRKDGMNMKGAIVVLIDLCKNSEEASEKIIELFDTSTYDDYDRGFCDCMRQFSHLDDIPKRKEFRNYDPRTQ